MGDLREMCVARPLLFAVLLTLPLEARAQDAPPGEGIWRASCARCHRDLTQIVAKLPDPSDSSGIARLDRFLAAHHARDPQARAALIDWLLAQESE
jgi:hypothetical protein